MQCNHYLSGLRHNRAVCPVYHSLATAGGQAGGIFGAELVGVGTQEYHITRRFEDRRWLVVLGRWRGHDIPDDKVAYEHHPTR